MPALSPTTTLPDAPDMARTLRAHLPDFEAVNWLTETGSTNTDLMDKLREHHQHSDGTLYRPRLLGAHWQRTGRGRVGRTLVNQPGCMLMFSCAFALRIAPVHLPCLSLVAGLAACEILRHHASPEHASQLAVKWPNDLQFGDAKLAGLLVESLRHRAAGPDAYGVVIGMGMNLRASQALTTQLQRPVADWSQAAGQTPLSQLAAEVALAWHTTLQQCAHDGFGVLQARFGAVDALHGRAVNVIDAGVVLHSGIARGVDDHSRLLIQQFSDDDPQTIAVSVGEVSVRAQTGMESPAS